MFAAFAIGNIIGPQVFQAKDAPLYHTAFAVHIALYGMSWLTDLTAAFFIVMTVILRFIMMRRNASRRKAYPGTGVAQVGNDTNLVHLRTQLWNRSNCNTRMRLTI